MSNLAEAISRIAIEVHPERIATICSAIDGSENNNFLSVVKHCLGDSFSPTMIQNLNVALDESPQITNAEISAMFRASSKTVELVSRVASVELVWSGPETSLVPIRHTEQVLTGLIDGARKRIFLVSFVAYNVGSVIRALQRAIERGVSITWAYRQIYAGKVKVISKLGRIMIPRSEVDRLLQETETYTGKK